MLTHQAEGVEFLTSRHFACLADDMGLGKTRQVIEAINRLEETRYVLIVCPKIAMNVWGDELREHLKKNLPVTVHKGWTPPPLPGVAVINYDRLSLASLWNKGQWDVLVIDESHYIKNPDALRSVWFTSGSIVGRRTYLLSGTPITGNVGDLWYPLRLAGLVGDFDDFKKQLTPDSIEYWKKKFAEMTLRRTKDDVLDLPPKTRNVMQVDSNSILALLAEERALYEVLYNAKECDNIEEFKRALNGLPKRQYRERLLTIRKEVGLRKVNFVADYVNKLDHQVIVFVVHIDVGNMLKSLIPNSELFNGKTPKKQREEILGRFKCGETRVLIANTVAAGVGITMVNCHHAIFAELDWSIVNLLQAEDRIYRLGQTHPVTIDYICHDESVDADIAQSLTQKETIINYLVKGGVR